MSALHRRAATLAASIAISFGAVVGVGSATSHALAPQLTGTWSRVAVPGVAGQPQALAYDPVHHQLLADVTVPGVGDQTAVLQGSTWRITAGLGGLTPVFDPALGATVGISSKCAATWSGTAWSSVTCAPFSRFGFPGPLRGAAYDGTRGAVVVVFDVFNGNCCSTTYNGTETWSWDGHTWSQLSPAKEPAPLTVPEPTLTCPDPTSCVGLVDNPLITEPGGATWDAARHKVVLVGDLWRTWTWNGSTWSGGIAPAPSTAQTSVAYDPAAGTDISFGYPALTAAWNGTVWQPIVTKGLPPTWGPTAYDTDLGGLVLLGAAHGGGLVDTSPGGALTEPATLWRFTPGV